MLVLVLLVRLVRCWIHMGSSLGHISTATAPMDLQPPSLAPFDAAAHAGILVWHSRHYLKPYRCLFWYFWSAWSAVGSIWDLLLAISQQLQHLWTSNHLHSLPLMQLHTLAYWFGILGTI